ncbi:MAG TPA: ABC transporter permease [Conexibacter sp.]|nr:ABC transporter permease [Conexibacter sp.]
MRTTYLRFELLRTLRNRRFFVFSLVFPLILYFVIAGPQKNDHDFAGTGIPAPLYFMVGLVSFGAMAAMLSSGARIAGEREVGWNRQLRITPLRPREYLRAKVVTAYMMAGISIVLMYVAGASLGVRIEAGRWVDMTLLILVGLVPFAAFGIFIGHRLTVDSIGPVMGGGISLLALLGGTWGPIATSGFFYDLCRALPSYWLVQASHVALGGRAWGGLGWGVMAAWSVICAAMALRAFRRDTERA